MAKFDYEKLRALRTNKGWSLRELGEKIDVTKTAVSRYETGEREPSLEMIERIANLFDLATGDLIRNKVNLTEDYAMTLRKEVLKEYAAGISAELIKLLMRENIIERAHPLQVYLYKLAEVQNHKILYAEDMEELMQIEGFLNEADSYVEELVEIMSRGIVA